MEANIIESIERIHVVIKESAKNSERLIALKDKLHKRNVEEGRRYQIEWQG